MSFIYRGTVQAALVLLSGVLPAMLCGQTPRPFHPNLRPGLYVAGDSTCEQAANAQLSQWDGKQFSDPHSSKCVSVQIGTSTAPYHVKTTCSAEGDGSPTKPFTTDEHIWIDSSTSYRVAPASGQGKGDATLYHWGCKLN